jgi:hypothetical protein
MLPDEPGARCGAHQFAPLPLQTHCPGLAPCRGALSSAWVLVRICGRRFDMPHQSWCGCPSRTQTPPHRGVFLFGTLDRLDRGNGPTRRRAADPISYYLFLDATPFLDFVAQSGRRLHASRYPVASSPLRRSRNAAADPDLYLTLGANFVSALAVWLCQRIVRRCCGRKRRHDGSPRIATAVGRKNAQEGRQSPVRFFYLLPGSSVRCAAH